MLHRTRAFLYRGQPDSRRETTSDSLCGGRRNGIMAECWNREEGRESDRGDGRLWGRMRLAGDVDGRG